MFARCYQFNQPMPWDTVSFSETSGMFSNCYKLNQNLGSWNLSSVMQMSTYYSPFHAKDVGDTYTSRDNPYGVFDLSPDNLNATLLGWAKTINIDTQAYAIHFPSTADDGTCTGKSEIYGKKWEVFWVDSSGNVTKSRCRRSF